MRPIALLLAAWIIGGCETHARDDIGADVAQQTSRTACERVNPGRNWLLARAADQAQKLALNPSAALERAILRDGFVPTSPESSFGDGGHAYVVQRGERLTDGAVRAYYVVDGNWATPRFVPR